MTECVVTEKERFVERLKAAQTAGLKDIKFMLNPNETLSEEEFFASANSFADAKKDKNFEVVQTLGCPQAEVSTLLS